jgi:DNA helicase-2/ATP-dependent DNA helicase PcrA
MSREYVLQSFRREVDLRIDYQADLNPQQREAVQAPSGPCLVLAGAGSGKTRTLIYRVAYLLEQGVSAEQILLLTFTNKAAREMMRRVSDLLGAELSQLWGGTFHSIGARILRVNADAIGFRNDYTILDRQDSEDLIRSCLGSLEEDVPKHLPKAEVFADILSRATNERRDIGDILARHRAEWSHALEEIEEVGKLYSERKRAANVMDFDDLLALWLRLLEEHPEIRERYQRRFQWVLVDEYQDTNQIQSDIIDLLAKSHRNVMAVGDDSQSIYSWRGANFRNILEFPRRYPGTRIFKVEINYRSTPEILAVANAAIAANQEQFTKVLSPARKSGPKPAVVACEDAHQQAAFVGQRICELAMEGVSVCEIAILYRSHFHALELQLELTRRGIPFLITSGMRFFEQAHVKDVAAWLKLLVNPTDELAFKRLVRLIPGIGPKAAGKLWEAYAGARRARRDSEREAASIAKTFMGIANLVPRKATVKWAEAATLFSQLEAPSIATRPAEMVRLVVDAFYEDYANAEFANASSRLEDLEHLAEFAGPYTSLAELLTQLSLLATMEAEADQRSATSNEDRVRLSTVHQAKGLEFKVVFVIMMSEGLFPSMQSIKRPESQEEERRLFYVAVTRAMDELYLSYPLLRGGSGQGLSRVLRSRFIGEIPPQLLEAWNLRPATTWRGMPTGENLVEDEENAPF